MQRAVLTQRQLSIQVRVPRESQKQKSSFGRALIDWLARSSSHDTWPLLNYKILPHVHGASIWTQCSKQHACCDIPGVRLVQPCSRFQMYEQKQRVGLQTSTRHGKYDTAHRLDPVLVDLDAKLADCSDGAEKQRIAGEITKRETRVIGVYRQVYINIYI